MKATASLTRDERGSIAVIFALSLTAIIAGVGAALDYARLSNTRTELQSALDAALLIAGKEALATGRKASRAAIVTAMKSNLPADLKGFADQVRIEQTDSKLTGSLSGTVVNRFGAFLGIERSGVAVATSVPLGSTRLDVALVLDSTGSMGQLGKMDALKSSANQLIDTLASTRQGGTEIAIGVVPFATQVRVETSHAAASWIALRKNQAIAAENTDAATWDGCVMDRDAPNNRKRDVPSPAKASEVYPAQNCLQPKLQRILPLTTNLPQVKTHIEALVPDGTTNTTIGMAWGYNVLNPDAPLGSGAAPASRKPVRVMVFLTDGLNTKDRFSQSTTEMDKDMRNLCRDSKNANIRVFTVRVIEGNDDLLRECASDPADFYTTNDSAGLVSVFRSIAQKLTTLRLSS